MVCVLLEEPKCGGGVRGVLGNDLLYEADSNFQEYYRPWLS